MRRVGDCLARRKMALRIIKNNMLSLHEASTSWILGFNYFTSGKRFMKPDVQDIIVENLTTLFMSLWTIIQISYYLSYNQKNRIKSSPAQQFFIEITSVFALAPTGFNFSLRTWIYISCWGTHLHSHKTRESLWDH